MAAFQAASSAGKREAADCASQALPLAATAWANPCSKAVVCPWPRTAGGWTTLGMRIMSRRANTRKALLACCSITDDRGFLPCWACRLTTATINEAALCATEVQRAAQARTATKVHSWTRSSLQKVLARVSPARTTHLSSASAAFSK